MTLVIGYGNPLRGDDGVGWAVAEALSHDLNGCDVVTVQVLLPELAESVARSARAVFVDARLGATPGRMSTDVIVPTGSDATSPGHAWGPGAVVHLAGQLYGWKGDAWLVSIEAAEFGYGTGLSVPVAAVVPDAVAAVRRLDLRSPGGLSSPPSARTGH
jgi:hydrogenase maturation protease